MNESEITCMYLKRTMMERLCAISESGASYLDSKRYVQELHYQQELLHYRELRLSSYLVWVGVKFSNAKEEELLINDASQIGSKKFDFSIE